MLTQLNNDIRQAYEDCENLKDQIFILQARYESRLKNLQELDKIRDHAKLLENTKY